MFQNDFGGVNGVVPYSNHIDEVSIMTIYTCLHRYTQSSNTLDMIIIRHINKLLLTCLMGHYGIS